MNDRDISLTFECRATKVNFLDLEIELESRQFKFQTHFKTTDRNSFIPTDSCHHMSWLKSVPRSQFLRLRRDCTSIDTYLSQASLLKQRLLEKGYDKSAVDLELHKLIAGLY